MINNRKSMYRPISQLATLGLVAVLASNVAVAATTTTTPATSTTSTQAAKTAAQTATQQQHLATIKSKGDAEINRRLTQLGGLNTLINSATRISAADKSTLTTQVNGEISGLTNLESQLNGETTLAAAITDAQSIYTEYRVYALITPKVHLIKVADDQQVNEANLATLATKLQSRLTTAQSNGKNVTALEATLVDLNNQVKIAQGISSTIETAVIGLQPSDYDSNHTVLSGDAAQLKTAQTANQAAFNDAKTIVQGVKNL
jgi:hypothetical protein